VGVFLANRKFIESDPDVISNCFFYSDLECKEYSVIS
jgi:hypothetical protein